MINDKIKCFLCGERAELKHDQYSGYQEPFTFQIYHCTVCCTGFSLPRINDTKELYDTIYTNGPNIPGYHRYWVYSEGVKKTKKPLNYLAESENVYWGIRQALRQVVKDKKSTSILEVGSGLGYLTYSLNMEGYDSFGLDISDTVVNYATKNYGDYFICGDIFNFVEKKKNTYDVVILTEVIEHINEPLKFLKTLMELIKPKGHILLTSPNKSIFSTKAIWATDNPPIHCWWFSEKSILYFGDKLNADVNFINFSKYYKKHFTSLLTLPIPNTHTLDKHGKPLLRIDKQKIISPYKRFKKFLLKNIPFIEKYYVRNKNINKTHTIILNQRGTTICALLQKK